MSSENVQQQSETVAEAPPYNTWLCVLCGVIYNEREGWPEEGIPPGTRWKDVPDDWVCPDCGAGKSDFEMTEI